MCWALRYGFQNGCGPDRCFPSVFEVVAKFLQQKYSSISPNFSGKNLAVLCLRCVIAHQTLFLPSFWHENTAIGMPYFHGKNPAKFHIWWAMEHMQGFALCIQCVLTCSHCDEPKPSKVLSMLVHVEYMGKPMSLGGMDQDNHTAIIVHTI